MEELDLILKQIANQGPIVILLAIILYWLRTRLEKKEQECKELVDKLNATQIDTIKVLTELNTTLDKLVEESEEGHVKTKESVTNQITSLKEFVDLKINYLADKFYEKR